MSAPQFTRAPWMASSGPSSVVGWPIVSCGAGAGAGRSIASVSWMPGLPDDLVTEIRANANLIAKAPELYSALDAMTTFVAAVIEKIGLTDTNNIVGDARAILSEARGEQGQ